jgi:hypothetical protein
MKNFHPDPTSVVGLKASVSRQSVIGLTFKSNLREFDSLMIPFSPVIWLIDLIVVCGIMCVNLCEMRCSHGHKSFHRYQPAERSTHNKRAAYQNDTVNLALKEFVRRRK